MQAGRVAERIVLWLRKVTGVERYGNEAGITEINYEVRNYMIRT